MRVVKIDFDRARRWIEKKHYTHRLGAAWECFGLLEGKYITGVVVYGLPNPAVNKYAFRDRDFRLYELTRLVVQSDTKNAASFLVANSLKMLSHRPCAVVSYADTKYGHCGIIYQATNWLYTGVHKGHGASFVVNGEIIHRKVYMDRFGTTSPTSHAKMCGHGTIDDTYKHRYFYLVGNRKQKKYMLDKLRYELHPYPKCNKILYDDGPRISDVYVAAVFGARN